METFDPMQTYEISFRVGEGRGGRGSLPPGLWDGYQKQKQKQEWLLHQGARSDDR